MKKELDKTQIHAREKKLKRMKRIRRLCIIAAIIVLIIIMNAINSAKQRHYATTELTQIKKRDMATSIGATGTISTETTKNVTSNLTGFEVKSVLVSEGQYVNKGETIATFDVEEVKKNLSKIREATSSQNISKRANESTTTLVENAKKQKDETSTQLEQTKKELEAAKTARDAATKALDDYKTTYNNAKAKYDPIKADYDAKVKARDDAKKAYDAQKAIVDAMKINQTIPAGITNTIANSVDNTVSNEVMNTVVNGNLAEEETKLKQLELDYSVKDAAVKSAQSKYDSETKKYNDIEQKYTELQSAKTLADGRVTTLETTKKQQEDSINNLETAINSANGNSVNAADLESALAGASSMGSISSGLGGLTGTNIAFTPDQMQKQIDNATVKAPVSGTITYVGVKPGDTYMGATIVTIDNTEAFVINSEVGEYDIPDVKVGMDVKIKTDATRDEILEGKVTYVALSSTGTEQASNASSSTGYGSLSSLASTFSSMTAGVSSTNAKYKVKIDINTPSDRLRVGMNAKASIITDKKESVLTVPYEAVIKREDNSHYIRVVKEGYDINEAVRKLKELLNKEEDNKERETTTVQTETLENMIEEIDVNVGIEGSYYTEISSDKIKENMYVVVPEIETNNTIKELIQMMGAGAGV